MELVLAVLCCLTTLLNWSRRVLALGIVLELDYVEILTSSMVHCLDPRPIKILALTHKYVFAKIEPVLTLGS